MAGGRSSATEYRTGGAPTGEIILGLQFLMLTNFSSDLVECCVLHMISNTTLVEIMVTSLLFELIVVGLRPSAMTGPFFAFIPGGIRPMRD
jgi:hypothetical protein